MTADPEIRLRPARDSDSAGVIAVIGRTYREYHGCVLDVDADEPELRAPASSYDGFWVLERADEIVGSCGYWLKEADGSLALEIQKVYLNADLRGRGLGRLLIETLENRAAELGVDRLTLWTDTRFETAHAVYERMGFRRTGQTRELRDRSNSREYQYEKRR
jgi:GNAT superfamily N-acetyltransferase